MILMHETTQERAQMVAERIRCQHRMEMGFHPLSDWQAKPSVIRVTVSIGSTSLHLENDSLPEMLTRADRALYTAKESGRNRACIQA